MSLKELKDVVKQGNIVDVISHYFPVQKKGSLHETQCPFHNDTNPSLKINEEKGIFKCFVCNTAGDSIGFVQQHEKIEFVEALKKTAKILNIPVENYLDAPRKNPKKEMGKRVLKVSQKIFLKHAYSDQYKNIIENFLEKRKLSAETAKKFGIGYTPGRGNLAQYLQRIPNQQERDFAIKEALEISVIKANEHKRLYDYFNNRITFPIWDFFGSIVGFGSRVLEKDQVPKYLNSKESYLFNKRNLLYGFHLAKPTIREKDCVILVEGYMDAIALHQAGFSQTVAIMGIAISEQNAKELQRLTKNIYLALDADEAGLRAMERVNHEFLKLGIVPKYLDFTPHNDPDDYIQAEGQDKFNQLMEKAPAFLDYQLSKIKDNLDENATPEIKRQSLNQAFEMMSPLGMSISATERVASFASQLGLHTAPADLIKNYEANLKPKKAAKLAPARAPKQATRGHEQSYSQGMPQEPPPGYYEQYEQQAENIQYHEHEAGHEVSDSEHKKEIYISASLNRFLQSITAYPQVFEDFDLAEVLDFLSHTDVKRYINRAFELYFESDEGEYEKLLRTELENDDYPHNLKEVIFGVLFSQSSPPLNKKDQGKLIEGMIKSLKIDSLLMKKREIRELHKTSKNMTDYNGSLKQIHAIDQQIAKLKT